jgi:HSP20 family protein
MATKNGPARALTKQQPSFTDQLIDPFSRFRNEIDRLFSNLPTGLGFPFDRLAKNMTVPAIEMKETPKKFKFSMELPGVDSKDIDVTVENGALVITGQKREEKEEDENGYHYSERSYGSFARRFDLPSSADSENVKANSKNGVLHITVGKTANAERDKKRIAIDG